MNVISLTEDTKRSLPVKPVVASYIVDKYSVYFYYFEFFSVIWIFYTSII